MTDSSTVGIVLAVHNGAAYLEEQVESIRAQTHEKWRLWIRDDGSTDDTAELVDRLVTNESRESTTTPNVLEPDQASERSFKAFPEASNTCSAAMRTTYGSPTRSSVA